MPQPRQILAGQFYLITRRVAQRQFLMRPDPETNNAFLYCLAEAAQRFGILVLMVLAESNHYHAVIFERGRRVSEFIEHFHKMFARSQNALRGHWENFWAAEEPCVTRLLDPKTVIDKMVYTAANPVKDFLVERAHHWPGVSGYVALKNDITLRATRPLHFFRAAGPMPEEVTLRLTIPEKELGLTRQQVVDAFVAGVEQVEAAASLERRDTGRRVFGRRNVMRQSYKDAPSSKEPRRNRRPRFAGRLRERVLALASYRDFLSAYKDARDELLAGRRSLFPIGTYWLHKFAAVPLVPIPTATA